MIDQKQKAKELVDKFMNLELALGGKYDGYFFMHLDDAKECAKIHVEGIIEASPSLPILGDSGTFGEDIELSKTYWHQVLTEIENL